MDLALTSIFGGTVATEQLTQEELLHSLHNDRITVSGKVYQGAWKIAKGTRETLTQAIKNKTLLLSGVKQANGLLDGKNITYNSASTVYAHIFSTRDSRVQALLSLKPQLERETSS